MAGGPDTRDRPSRLHWEPVNEAAARAAELRDDVAAALELYTWAPESLDAPVSAHHNCSAPAGAWYSSSELYMYVLQNPASTEAGEDAVSGPHPSLSRCCVALVMGQIALLREFGAAVFWVANRVAVTQMSCLMIAAKFGRFDMATFLLQSLANPTTRSAVCACQLRSCVCVCACVCAYFCVTLCECGNSSV